MYYIKEGNIDLDLEECLPHLINTRMCFLPIQSIMECRREFKSTRRGFGVSLGEVESLIDSLFLESSTFFEGIESMGVEATSPL